MNAMDLIRLTKKYNKKYDECPNCKSTTTFELKNDELTYICINKCGWKQAISDKK